MRPLSTALSLFSLSLPAAAQLSAASGPPDVLGTGSQLIVDDDFGPSTPGWQNTRFDLIGDALDAAAPGDRIVVLAGSYPESLTLDKAVSVIGAAPGAVFVDSGPATALRVTADRASVQGLTFRDAAPQTGINAELFASHTTLLNNAVESPVFSLLAVLAGASENRIEGTVGFDSLYVGFGASPAAGNRLVDNATALILLDNADGSVVAGNDTRRIDVDSSPGTLVTANRLLEGKPDGIEVEASPGCVIRSNEIGGMPAWGVRLVASPDCVVADNRIVGAASDAITVESGSGGAEIVGNHIEHASPGIEISAPGNTVVDNTLVGCGVVLLGFGSAVWTDQVMEDNTVNGLPLRYYASVSGPFQVPADTGQVVLGGCDGFTVDGLAFAGVNAGVQAGYSPDLVVRNCDFSDMTSPGVQAVECDGAQVMDNRFVDCHSAVVGGVGCTVTGNRSEACFFGLTVSGAGGLVAGNVVLGAARYGIGLQGFHGGVVEDNLVVASGLLAGDFGIELLFADDVTLRGNALLGNSGGVRMLEAAGGELRDNQIGGCTAEAVWMQGADVQLNELFDNVLSGNALGLLLEEGARNNTLRGNQVAGGAQGALLRGFDSSGNRFARNAFDNALNAEDTSSGNLWDDGFPAGGNWWSDYVGVDADGDGLGDQPYAVPGGSAADGYPLAELEQGLLFADAATLSTSGTATVSFELRAGAANAGRTYVLLAGTSGTTPGTPLDGATLPLNLDPLSDLVLAQLGTPTFSGFFGQLDASGSATAQLNAPPLASELAGSLLHFAFALLEPSDFVSRPLALAIYD
ncbi:MAG: NosD domain-containing protein [Planctomycetota bacterium]